MTQEYNKYTVACVYWEGEFRGREMIYSADWVVRLSRMVSRNFHESYRFVCLTNVPHKIPAFIDTIQLKHDLPGWWSKMEVFQAFPKGARVLVLDLDLLVMRDLRALILYPAELAIGTAVGPFNKTVKRGDPMSGVFAFTAGLPLIEDIWEDFITRKGAHIKNYRGDNDFLGRWERKFGRYPEGLITKLRYCPGQGKEPDPKAIIIHCMPHKNNKAASLFPWIKEIWQ